MRKAIAVLAAGLTIAVLPACSAMNQQTQTCKVTSKERIFHEGSSTEKRVYTTCGAFKAEDNFSSGFNSGDIWGRLQEGHTYQLKTGGYRVGFLSTFPNILEAKEVNG